MAQFINPYTFVSVDTKKAGPRSSIDKQREEKETITGKIHCRLTPKTPLIIPNSSNEKVFTEAREHVDHKSYEFFSYEDLKNVTKNSRSEGPKNPVIPGSQLRGMIRSAYETVTDSCFLAVNGETIVARRVGKAKEPGLLIWEKDARGNDVLKLYDATRYMLELDNYGYENETYRNKKTKIYKFYDEDGRTLALYKLVTSLNTIAKNLPEYEKEAVELKRLKKELIDKTKEFNHATSTQKGELKKEIGKLSKELDERLLKLIKNPDCGKYFHLIKEGSEVYINTNSSIAFRTSRNHPTNAKVLRDTPDANLESKMKPGLTIAYLHLGENFGDRFPNKRHHESVFVRKNDKIEIKDEEEIENLFKRLDYLLNFYQDKKINVQYKPDEYQLHHGHKGYKKAFEEFKNKEKKVLPVYYNRIGTNGGDIDIFLSPSQITKEVYKNQIQKAIGLKLPCDDTQKLCEACKLFGTSIQENAGKNKSVSSRVRFTDAYLAEGEVADYGQVVTLPILGSPKPSAAEFYLKKSRDVDYWCYDYIATTNPRNPREQIYRSVQPAIRGRKYYWHFKPNHIAKIQRTGLNSTVRPLEKGEFEFDVYFEKLTEIELKRLLWVLCIGSNENDNCHKIGHGKPLGYGSIKIEVEKVEQRLVQCTDEGISISYDDKMDIQKIIGENPVEELFAGFNTTTIDDYRKVTSFTALEANDQRLVSYPYKEENPNKDKTFEWFQKNAPLRPTQEINQELPDVKAKNQKLYT